jgi:hypothetical protein
MTMTTLIAGRPMAKRKDVVAKIDGEVLREAKIAAALKGMTLAEYLSEVVRVVAARDIDEAMANRAAKGKPGKTKDAR